MTDKPICLPVQFATIPLELKRIPRWVLWRLVEVGDEGNKRWSKLPTQVTGQPASSTNPATWTDFPSVQHAYEEDPEKFAGIGFVFTSEDNLIGVDLDDCFDHTTARFTNAALQHISDELEGYHEVSPSGTGIKIFTRADLAHAHVDHSQGLEIYPQGRFFTVTGHYLGGTIPTEAQDLSAFIPERALHVTGDAFADYVPPVEGYDLHRVEMELLSKLDPDCGYTDWMGVGFALFHQFGGDVEACELWDRWSSQSGKYASNGMNSCESKWRTFKSGGATLRSIIFKVNQKERADALARGEIVLDSGAMNHARTFLDALYSSEEGYRLVHYAEDFFIHAGTHYEIIEEATIRSKLYAFLDKCKKPAKGGALAPFNPSPASVSGAMDAIKSIVHLANQPNTKPPIWFEEYQANKPDASKLISVKNGLFHLEDKILLPHSLGFFTQHSLPFQFPQITTHSANPIGSANIMGYINNFLMNEGQPQNCVRVQIPHTV